ncbi:hypothetical protein FF1_009104 [Malus domestica]
MSDWVVTVRHHEDMQVENYMTKEEIDRLPKYKFRKIPDFDKVNGEIQESFGGVMNECDTTTPTEHVLSPEDAVSSMIHS